MIQTVIVNKLKKSCMLKEKYIYTYRSIMIDKIRKIKMNVLNNSFAPSRLSCESAPAFSCLFARPEEALLLEEINC